MAQHEYAPAKAQGLTGEDISTDVITGANNVDEALGVLDDAIATNNDHIATITANLGNKVNFYKPPTAIGGGATVTVSLAYGHIYLVSVTGNTAWGSSSTIVLVSPGTNGQMVKVLSEGTHTVSLSGLTLTIATSTWGSAYYSVIALA